MRGVFRPVAGGVAGTVRVFALSIFAEVGGVEIAVIVVGITLDVAGELFNIVGAAAGVGACPCRLQRGQQDRC